MTQGEYDGFFRDAYPKLVGLATVGLETEIVPCGDHSPLRAAMAESAVGG